LGDDGPGLARMGLEEAVEYALSEEQLASSSIPGQQKPPASRLPTILSHREEEVAALVARGLTNRRISSELHISEHTAATHVRRILKKLGLRSRAQIGSWVTERGLTPHNPR
jgi:DNA-binding NarL/FixJ family response regulator